MKNLNLIFVGLLSILAVACSSRQKSLIYGEEPEFQQRVREHFGRESR